MSVDVAVHKEQPELCLILRRLLAGRVCCLWLNKYCLKVGIADVGLMCRRSLLEGNEECFRLRGVKARSVMRMLFVICFLCQ